MYHHFLFKTTLRLHKNFQYEQFLAENEKREKLLQFVAFSHFHIFVIKPFDLFSLEEVELLNFFLFLVI